ncbi:MAG: DUF1801 domain-containing protein [Candidatus Magasanikbacteria bacterium]
MSNMFKPIKAKNVKEYLASIPEERKETILFLHDFIQKVSPKLKSHFAYNMLGYGSFAYKNYKRDVIEWPIVALASQKNYMSVYVCAVEDGEYLAEKYKDKLGKVSVGKSCIRFKKLDDLHLGALKKILQKSAKHPGLVGAEKYRKTSVKKQLHIKS